MFHKSLSVAINLFTHVNELGLRTKFYGFQKKKNQSILWKIFHSLKYRENYNFLKLPR